MKAMEEKATYIEELTITKYKNEVDKDANNSYEELTEKCSGENCLLNAGITKIWNLTIGVDAAHYASDNSEIGVGDSNIVVDATQTDLQAVTNKTWKGMESSYPAVSAQKVSFKAEFGASDANYHWKEFAVRQTGANVLLNRIVSDKGTKASGEVWVVTKEITLS